MIRTDHTVSVTSEEVKGAGRGDEKEIYPQMKEGGWAGVSQEAELEPRLEE